MTQTAPPSAASAAAARGDRTRRRWVPLVAGLLCAAVGLLDVLSGLTPELRSRLRVLAGYVPGGFAHAAAALTVVSGVLLLLLAHGLRRRKHRAWRATVLLLALSVVLHIVKGLDVEEAVVSVALLVALVVARRDFYAVGDPRTRWRAAAAFVGLGLLSVALGLLLIEIRADVLVGHPSWGARLRHVVEGLAGITGPLQFRSGRVEDVVSDTLVALGWLVVLVTAYLLLRPPEPFARLLPEDEQRMRALLARHGARDSLGYFALRRDKSVVWSPTGKACIAYRVVSGVMLAAGDPLGDPEAWPGAICAFLDIAAAHAWVPAVMGCGEQGGEVWTREAGLQALELGDEAIVEVAEFSLEGRAMRNVRQAVARAERAGFTCTVRRTGEMSAEEVAHIRAQAAAWRGAQTERGFSMALGRFGDPRDADCVTVLAHQGEVLRALLHFVPWGDDGLSLDLMRRDRGAENGVNELLIVSALREAPGMGVTRMSLNFAVFRSALERGERLGASPISRGWRALLVFASRWFQIESLYRFNAKFRPLWEPRFVCYRRASDIPRVAMAALEAEAFLVWPRPTLRRLRALTGARET